MAGQEGETLDPQAETEHGHIVNVEPKHVRFSPGVKDRRYFRRKRSRALSVSDDSEILRTKMTRIRKNLPGSRPTYFLTSKLDMI